ncbi:MAG: hypothetical protein ABIX01_03295 [Chitinophagaceae bacterium]
MKRKFGLPIFTSWKPAILLLIITPILTELLSNNIPANRLFEPKLFLMMVCWVYGPVLLLRELAVRWKLSVAGYIFLGLVYGIYNEGLLGKTFFQVQIPNTAFDHYGFIWGINLPWAAVMTVFHACFALLFPVLWVYNIFPKLASRPWLNTKWWIGFSIAAVAYTSYQFLKNTRPASPFHYVALIAIMCGLIIFSRFFTGGFATNDRNRWVWLLVIYGIVFVATTFTLASVIAAARLNILFFLTYALINLLLAVLILSKRYNTRQLLFFALAAQLGFSASIILVAILTKSNNGLVTASAFALVFVVTLAGLFLKKKLVPGR